MNKDKLINWIQTTSGLWVVFIAWSLFISNLWLPRNWGFYGNNDWDLTYATFEAARKSIMEYGEWPIFNPYAAFGTDTVANPQAVNGGIFFTPVLIFGTFYGYKLSLLLAIIIGCWGSFKCFKLINNNKWIALLVTFLFVGCSFFSRHLFEAGHSNVMYLYLLPWIIYGLQKILIKPTMGHVILPIFLLAQTLTSGAPIVFITCCILILMWSIGLCFIEKRGIKPIIFFSAIILISIGISMWKIWPVIQYWQHAPRLVKDDSGINLLVWLQSLADFETDTRTWHDWFEFSLGFSLILVGIIYLYIKQIKKYQYWLFLALPLLWLCMGNIPENFSLWHILNTYAPIFSSLRAPYRFGIIIVFVLCITLMRVLRDIEYSDILWIVLFFAVISQTLNFNATSKKFTNSKRLDDIKVTKNMEVKPIKIRKSEYKHQFLFIQQNYLIQNAYEPLFLSKVTDTSNSLVQGAQLVSFSPNKIVLMDCDSAVNVNLRYNHFWTISGKGNLMSHNGDIQINNAKGNITLTYFNTDIWTGLWLSFYSLIILLISFWSYIKYYA